MTIVKTPKGQWRGYSDEDDKNWKRFKRWRAKRGAGEFFTMSYDYERVLAHHKKLMALVTYIADNSDTYNNKDKALVAVKIAAGHCDFVVNPLTGELVASPRSINFKKMKQGAFEEFYANALQGVVDHILPYMNKVDLQVALENISRF
jgi:hypothetical protein